MDKDTVQKADKSYRRKLLLSYLAIICTAVILWNFFRLPLLNNLENLPNKERVEVKELLCELFMLSFIPVAIYVISIGRKICRYKVVPYPGMKVIRDTEILTGKKALFRGKFLITLGIATIVLTVAGTISTHFIVLNFKHNPFFSSVFYK